MATREVETVAETHGTRARVGRRFTDEIGAVEQGGRNAAGWSIA